MKNHSTCPTFDKLLREREAAMSRSDGAGLIEGVEWLMRFEEHLSKDTPEKIANVVAQLGVDVDGKCSCSVNDSVREKYPVIAWIHDNHTVFNRAVHELLCEYELLAPVRGVVRRDVTGPAHAEYPECGQIMLREFGQLLLTYFLTTRPHHIWVG